MKSWNAILLCLKRTFFCCWSICAAMECQPVNIFNTYDFIRICFWKVDCLSWIFIRYTANTRKFFVFFFWYPSWLELFALHSKSNHTFMRLREIWHDKYIYLYFYFSFTQFILRNNWPSAFLSIQKNLCGYLCECVVFCLRKDAIRC